MTITGITLEGIFEQGSKQAPAVLTFPYPPSANRYWRNYRGVTVVSDEARSYKHEVAILAKQQGAQLLHGDVIVHADVYRPMRRGDLSNRWKVLEDALIGACYDDDAQVVEIHLRRFDDKHNPRVEVTVEGH